MEDLLFNVKCNWKHAAQEYEIKRLDSAQDMSRSAVFVRMVDVAQNISNWKEIQVLLSNVKKGEDTPVFTSFQARYDEITAAKLEQVKKDILGQIGTLKVLQTQYLLQLLQANYLEVLKQALVSIKSDGVREAEVDLPEMAKIFTEMMLMDKESEKLVQIRKILVDWRNSR
jgi:hypothetical protein